MRLYDILFPRKCIGCGEILGAAEWDSPFCCICMKRWEKAREFCILEHRGQPIMPIGTDEDDAAVLFLVYYLKNRRNAVQNRLIYSLKNGRDRRATKFAAHSLAELIKEEASFLFCESGRADKAVITWIPRSSSSVKRFGFDQMERTAKELSKLLSIKYLPLIVRKRSGTEQKFLSMAHRLTNAESSLRLNLEYSVLRKNVILIDDVTTSGSSLLCAVRLLREAGARQVICAVIAKSDRGEEGEF